MDLAWIEYKQVHSLSCIIPPEDLVEALTEGNESVSIDVKVLTVLRTVRTLCIMLATSSPSLTMSPRTSRKLWVDSDVCIRSRICCRNLLNSTCIRSYPFYLSILLSSICQQYLWQRTLRESKNSRTPPFVLSTAFNATIRCTLPRMLPMEAVIWILTCGTVHKVLTTYNRRASIPTGEALIPRGGTLLGGFQIPLARKKTDTICFYQQQNRRHILFAHQPEVMHFLMIGYGCCSSLVHCHRFRWVFTF